MLFLLIRRLGVVAASLLFAVSGIASASAKTIDIPTTDAHIDVPDDWSLVNRQNIALYAFAPEKGRSLTVTLYTNENGQGVEQRQFAANMEELLAERANKEGASIKVINHGITDLNGVPADFLLAELAFAEGGVAYARTYALAENNSILVITLLTRDPTADASQQAIARTLRFDRPPFVPGANLWTTLHLGRDLLVFAAVVIAAWVVIAFARRRPKPTVR
jgi:hypothetical protein